MCMAFRYFQRTLDGIRGRYWRQGSKTDEGSIYCFVFLSFKFTEDSISCCHYISCVPIRCFQCPTTVTFLLMAEMLYQWKLISLLLYNFWHPFKMVQHFSQNGKFPSKTATYLGVSKNRGTPKSSILIGFSTINHPFRGNYPFFGNTYLWTLMGVQPDGRNPSWMKRWMERQ